MTIATNDDDDFRTELVALIPHMRAFARTLCNDRAQAEDLAQDALARAWASRDRFEMGTNMKAWTFMILRNQFYSDKRRSWRSSQLDPEVAERTLVAVTSGTANLELDELRRAMAMLPDVHALDEGIIRPVRPKNSPTLTRALWLIIWT